MLQAVSRPLELDQRRVDRRLPLVLFAEGGGGRDSDTDAYSVGALQLDTFHRFARLSGLVPLVGITLLR